MSDRRTFELPLSVVVELRFRGCTCEPIGAEVNHDGVPGGVYRFVVHEDRCHLLWLRQARWN